MVWVVKIAAAGGLVLAWTALGGDIHFGTVILVFAVRLVIDLVDIVALLARGG